ncbi:hypothetical protein CHS0354_010335 [Potamilus streckersoni]|uniref:Uncharacterized protein n=1 Tax=Potamilus streckersoni TaxID=2493646 RepID=A0AAE0WAV1_9BIVA|nr:hypothetical protein CHS0354_010335 [Potamilus streckersoni]
METSEKRLLDDEQKPKSKIQHIFEPGKLNEQQDLKVLPIVSEDYSTADSSFAKMFQFDDIDDVDFNDNFIISEQERKAWENMIKDRQQELVKQKEKFERWEEEMTKRKIFVLRKLKKLRSYHSKRIEFYTWTLEYH